MSGDITTEVTRLEERYAGNREALEVLAAERKEIDLYSRFSDFYGYQFYIGQLDV